MNDDELDLVTSWAEGWLGGDAARRARELVDADPELAEHVEWVALLRSRTAALTYEAPDPSVTRAIVESFSAVRARPSVVRRLVAALSLDSRSIGLAGVRSPLNLDSSWDQVFRSDPIEVVLTCVPHAGGVTVVGQVLDSSGGRVDATVQLLSPTGVVDATIADALGEFEIEASLLDYEVLITLEDRGVEVSVPMDLRRTGSDA